MEKLFVVWSSDIDQIRNQLNSAMTKNDFKLH